MIKIDHLWGSKATPCTPHPPKRICLPFTAAMMNAISVICHKFFQHAATLSLPDWENPQCRVVELPCCDHTHRWILLICEVDLSLNTLIKQPFIHYGSLCCLFCVLDVFIGWYEFMIGMQLQHWKHRSVTDRLYARPCFLAVVCEQGPVMVQWRDQYSVRHSRHHGVTRIKEVLIHRYSPAAPPHAHTKYQCWLTTHSLAVFTHSLMLSYYIPHGMTYTGGPVQKHGLHSCTCEHKHTHSKSGSH